MKETQQKQKRKLMRRLQSNKIHPRTSAGIVRCAVYLKNTGKGAILPYMVNLHSGVADSFGDPTNDAVLTRAIVDTIREPLIVLTADLRIVVASRSFYETFGVVSKRDDRK